MVIRLMVDYNVVSSVSWVAGESVCPTLLPKDLQASG
jgi:hypothetical protein